MGNEVEMLRMTHSVRGYRPAVERLPIDEGTGDPPAARRPLDAAARQIADDGLQSVARAQNVGLLAAAQIVAGRMQVGYRRVLRWRFLGFDLAGLGYVFGAMVEAIEWERRERDYDILHKKPASQAGKQATRAL
jgi:hypothetical protein